MVRRFRIIFDQPQLFSFLLILTILPGKPHPRWADPNYYDGDASDKWHTRSQKRGNAAAAALAKQRRQQSPTATTPSIKTEPVSEMQHPNCYYRLSPSPPPSATSTTYSMNIGQAQANAYAQNAYGAACANGNNGNAGYSPAAYSPSSTSSSGLNGLCYLSRHDSALTVCFRAFSKQCISLRRFMCMCLRSRSKSFFRCACTAIRGDVKLPSAPTRSISSPC